SSVDSLLAVGLLFSLTSPSPFFRALDTPSRRSIIAQPPNATGSYSQACPPCPVLPQKRKLPRTGAPPRIRPHPYPADLPHHCLFALDAHFSICGKHDSPLAHSPPTRRPAGSVARPTSSLILALRFQNF
ncbi:hypothetical protein IWZ00DRAFT_537819, partial [Phyllosticta capitalensis]